MSTDYLDRDRKDSVESSFARVNRAIKGVLGNRVLPYLPRAARTALLGPENSWAKTDLQPVATAQGARIRCLIAPANFGSQGYYWARAANLLDGVWCTNLQFVSDAQQVIGPAAYTVNSRVGKFSRPWAKKQEKAITTGFTHLLIEAATPILGGLNGADLKKEVRRFQNAGVKVGFISHGSEVRLPSLHRQKEPHSPFAGDLQGRTATLENKAKLNLSILDEMRLDEFVSTPDLLDYREHATWLPLLTDSEKWTSLPPIQLGERLPVVLHVPSSRPALKGSDAIRQALMRLDEEGLIDYLEVNGVPYESMPDYVGQADIVVNQVGIGAYGAFALESMLAGRVVVTQVWKSVREYIEQQTGFRVPIVEANPDTVYEVVRKIAARPEDYKESGNESREFALSVHSPQMVAERLKPFLYD